MSNDDENLELPEVEATIEVDEESLDAAYAEEEAQQLHEEEELQHHRKRSLVTAAEILKRNYPEEQYLIGPNILPRKGKLLITAETGVGKSYIALHIAACLATATPLFGLIHRRNENFGEPLFPVTHKHYIAYLDYEIPEQQRQSRLRPLAEQFATTPNFEHRIGFFKKASDYRLLNIRGEVEAGKGSFDKFFDAVRCIQPDVLIIDPFSSTHSLNEISNEIKQPLNQIDRIIDHVGCAVILVHHSSPKSKSDGKGRQLERSIKEMPRGHSSILDWADSHMHFSDMKVEHGTTSRVLQLDWGKVRYGKPPLSRQLLLDYERFKIEPFSF